MQFAVNEEKHIPAMLRSCHLTSILRKCSLHLDTDFGGSYSPSTAGIQTGPLRRRKEENRRHGLALSEICN
ncbi:hypothetical protein JTE90_027649 [Oedothorax gibbosus]|uniref:Uncharacterized protein n=1 Tax=Oedothorax gibbosus TaxID=931172 RepID=A0AAV6URC3_9ARAC|nr:hypothetical protein JTE90_027649 [Oedothorax gibbosus]